MVKLFHYNWLVRNECFELCKQIPLEQLFRLRVGGTGSIHYTFFHIADVEYSWIRGVQGKPDTQVQYENYKTLQQVQELSDAWNQEVKAYLDAWSEDVENEMVNVPWMEGRFTKGEILRHVIAHEIHHMGQLSIWVRQIGMQPVSANVIGRGLFTK